MTKLVIEYNLDTLGQITKTEIMKKCPDISQVTVQRALGELVTRGRILKNGVGRYTAYMWNHNKENSAKQKKVKIPSLTISRTKLPKTAIF